MSSQPWVIVVGAGPSGLLLALLLAKQGIQVQVVEAATEPNDQPRATHYGSPAVRELERAGVLEDMRKAGFQPRILAWRRLDATRTKYTGINCEAWRDNPHRMICLPLQEVTKILLDHLERDTTASISWGCKVVGVGQDAENAWVEIEGEKGAKEVLHASYVVGCDGANSQVRRSLFGDMEFPGHTWPVQVVATNIYFPFEKYGYDECNFIIDPEYWHMSSQITKDGMWRMSYGAKAEATREELLEQHPELMKKLLPGPDEWRLTNFSPYKVHQRLAPKMRVGRICLAADAAHLCNPFGGLGLTSGIVDVGCLFDCLAGIHAGVADERILDKYDEIRRQKFRDFIDPISSDNLRRMWQDPDKVMDVDPFLQFCKRTETEEDLAEEAQRGMNVIMHDFRQYYSRSIDTATNGISASL